MALPALLNAKPDPSMDDLMFYESVLIFGYEPFHDAEALGDALADYYDSGGVVVVAGAVIGGDPRLMGRWHSDKYYLMDDGLVTDSQLGDIVFVNRTACQFPGVKMLAAVDAWRSCGAVVNN